MERQSYERLREEVYRDTLPSGLTVRIVPKPGYHKRYATFATRYGSIDNWFVKPGASEATRVPDGIAHFLEHKMFEQKDGNVFNRFAALGAQVNAATTYTSTTYLFSTNEHFRECLELLLDFVQEPHFTPENVRKEQGIIAQEIRMYEDNADWRLQDNLMGALYHAHPVRIDIAGTVESIERIDPDILYLCHRTFYHPSNMAVLVVGDVDPEAVLAQISDNIERRHYEQQEPVERRQPEEPPTLSERRREERLTVAMPMLALGFKDRPAELGLPLLRQSTAMEIALRAVLGRSSDLYNRLYEQGLLDDSFGTSYTGETSYAHAILGGETREPERLATALLEGIAEARQRGIPDADVERIRRAALGSLIAALQSPEIIAHQATADFFRGFDFFDRYDALAKVTAAEVNERFRALLDPEQCAMSVVWPKERV
ncbi:MAG: EF-P 5-aminopentanol modification-associated protein YfmH [Chloroflexota bacterium]